MMGIEKERIDFMKRSWICLGAIGMLLCGCTGTQNEMAEKGKEMKKEMVLCINGEQSMVRWEENETVSGLMDMLDKEGPIDILMHPYGGFEQVGDLGRDLISSDERITTGAGDIVLYQRNQIVVFFGSNTWEYTRLGMITDGSQQKLEADDVTISLKKGD